MHRRPLMRLIYVVLMFQLAIGMHVTAASVIGMTSGSANSPRGIRHCLVHQDMESDAGLIHSQVPAGKARSSPHAPTNRHDCCGLAGCQCQCTYAPILFDTQTVKAAASTAVPLPGQDTRIGKTRIDELFRPPIAQL